MGVNDYIKEKQPFLFRTFSNALASKKISHAYLLEGDMGTPLKEIGMFLVKSLLCDDPNPLACETCVTCSRVDKQEYPDLIILDGDDSSIKKEEVGEVIQSFSDTPLEKKGIMVYLVNKVEAMSIGAANALLKFLEEPTENTYAILTTENEEKVMQTIKSRCQQIRLLSRPRDEVLDECLKNDIPQDDAEVLSFWFSDPESIKEESCEDDFISAKKAILSFLETFEKGRDCARFAMIKDAIPQLNGKQKSRYFLEMLTLLIKDSISKEEGGKINLPSYGTITDVLIRAIPNKKKSLLEVMKLRGEAETNINTGLLMLHLVDCLFKE